MEGYLLVSAVSYSLSRSSSKMSTSTLAFPIRSGARLMRFLARVMESLSPLLHSMGSSRIAAAGAKALAAVRLGRDPARLRAPPLSLPFPVPLQDLRCHTSSRHVGTSAPAATIVSASSLPRAAFPAASPTSQVLPDTWAAKSLQQWLRYLPARRSMTWTPTLLGSWRCPAPTAA